MLVVLTLNVDTSALGEVTYEGSFSATLGATELLRTLRELKRLCKNADKLSSPTFVHPVRTIFIKTLFPMFVHFLGEENK